MLVVAGYFSEIRVIVKHVHYLDSSCYPGGRVPGGCYQTIRFKRLQHLQHQNRFWALKLLRPIKSYHLRAYDRKLQKLQTLKSTCKN